MKNFKLGSKRKALNKELYSKDAINAAIQPFKEMPPENNTTQINADRIDAHDLFSHYTADIIKKETVFFR